MRKLMFLVAALIAVVGAGVAYSASSPSAKLDKQDRLWGGGYVAPGTCSINVPEVCSGVHGTSQLTLTRKAMALVQWVTPR